MTRLRSATRPERTNHSRATGAGLVRGTAAELNRDGGKKHPTDSEGLARHNRL
jgi:hypothetical protein